MDQKPSDALTKRPRVLRTGLLVGATVLAVSGIGFGAYAVAQPSPAETPAATEGPAALPNVDPIASFSFLSTDGRTVTVDGGNSIDSDGQIVSYEWDFGDGESESGSVAEHSFADYDTFTVTLTVTDNDGGTGSFSAQVTLNAPPPPPPAQPDPPAGPAYGNYPPGYPMPRIPGTDQPDTSACASSTGTIDSNGNQVCA